MKVPRQAQWLTMPVLHIRRTAGARSRQTNHVDHGDHRVEATEMVADGTGSDLLTWLRYSFPDGDGSIFDGEHRDRRRLGAELWREQNLNYMMSY